MRNFLKNSNVHYYYFFNAHGYRDTSRNSGENWIDRFKTWDFHMQTNRELSRLSKLFRQAVLIDLVSIPVDSRRPKQPNVTSAAIQALGQ